MTQDEVIALARGVIHDEDFEIGFSFQELYAFARKVAELERDRCANWLEQEVDNHDREYKEFAIELAAEMLEQTW